MYLPISRFFIYPLFFLGCLLTYAQDVSLIPTVDTLQKLDISWFEKNEDINGGIIYLEDSTKVELIWQNNSYRKNLRKKNSPYVLTVLYDKKSGKYMGVDLIFLIYKLENGKVFMLI